MRTQPGGLYRIETNDAFPLEPVTADAVNPVLERWEFGPAISVHAVGKRNTASAMYRVIGADGTFMLRRVDAGLADATEVQCRIATAVRSVRFVRPLECSGGGHVVVDRGAAWCLYPALRGEIFQGEAEMIGPLMEGVAAFQDELGALAADLAEADRAALPHVTHRPERWPAFFAVLVDPSQWGKWPHLDESLSPGTRRLLESRAPSVVALSNEVQRPTVDEPRLVHNDLQHANVLVDRGSVAFLDLEDVCWERRGIATAHAAFKLVRHCVYRGAASSESASAALGAALEGSLRETWQPPRRHAFTLDAAFRIMSDIYEINAWTVERGDPSQLYDLEKRIHNLFELMDLVGETT